MLFQKDDFRFTDFEKIANNVFLLLSQKQSIKIRNTVVQRQQISLITEYCVIKYKTQESIYSNAVLNLQQ